jgi:hypothetical protein
MSFVCLPQIKDEKVYSLKPVYPLYVIVIFTYVWSPNLPLRVAFGRESLCQYLVKRNIIPRLALTGKKQENPTAITTHTHTHTHTRIVRF